MTASSIPVPPVRGLRWWRAAQSVGVVLTVALLVALSRWPQPTLRVLWDMVIPILPAVFLLNPMIWRNVCPLATLNHVPGAKFGRRALKGRRLRIVWAIGIVLLLVMVPARRFLFNEDGPALLVTIVAVAALAVALGLVFSRRAGFCNALCPVLPVEKLYGQAPLVRVSSPRCRDCNLCSPLGCIDLAPGKSLVLSLGRSRRDPRWFLSPLGAFAAAFPGFVLGYFTIENGGLAAAKDVYLHVGIWALVSFGLVTVLSVWLRLSAATMLPALGALAAGGYYWYAAPTLAEAYRLPVVAPILLRAAALGLIAVWLLAAFSRRAPLPSS